MQASAFGIGNAVENSVPEPLIFGRSAAMHEVRQAVERVADISVPVLLQGERGTGKELIGREIHRRSRWREGPFVRVRSRGLNTISGKQSARVERENLPVCWPKADSHSEGSAGTLFFDEVSELTPSLQATLLGLFREHPSVELSNAANGHSGSRIICSTRKDLEEEITAGNFRSDLYYRINIVTIQLPRLHDRREDIPGLVDYFFQFQCRRQGRYCQPIPIDVLQLFCEYQWPGNIRELENHIKRYVSTHGQAAAVSRVHANLPMDISRRR